jgi:hypothetical protein
VILILTMTDDIGSDRVERLLRARGAAVVRFDLAEFPERAQCSLRYRCATGWHRQIDRRDGTVIDLDEVTAVWLRRPVPPAASTDVVDPVIRHYIDEEWREVTDDLMASLRCLWVPAPLAVVRTMQRKFHVLMRAHQLGFRVPECALTSRASDLFDLHRACHGNIITKQAGPTAFPRAFRHRLIRYTERVSARDLGYARNLWRSPIMVQENLGKRLEIRVTVVGEHVFAGEIDSQRTHRTRQDWRRYDHANTTIRAHALPAAIESRCAALTAELGLVYSALDLVLTPDGEYVFLEINPAGEYGWMEDATRHPITEAVADLLISANDRPENHDVPRPQ